MSRNYLLATAHYEFVSPMRPEDIAADLRRFTVRNRDDTANYGDVGYFAGMVDAGGFALSPVPGRRNQSLSLSIIGRITPTAAGSRVTVRMRPNMLFSSLRMVIILATLMELSRAIFAFSMRDLMIAACSGVLLAAMDIMQWTQIGWQRRRLSDHLCAPDPEREAASNRPGPA